jgi:hypothetical protein
VWPANTVVARAYIDQLNRTKAILPGRAKAVTDALGRADKIRTSRDKNAATAVKELNGLATQLEGDASSAAGQDAARFRLLANLIKERSAKLQ